MAKLINLTEQMEAGTLPPNILRGIYKGIVMAGENPFSHKHQCKLSGRFCNIGICLTDPDEKNTYYQRILEPLKNKFKQVLGQENFGRMCENEQVQKVVIDLLESFIGVARGKSNIFP